jgi:hypothetical protein
MKTRNLFHALLIALALLALAAGAAFAKPGHGGSKATITGPGYVYYVSNGYGAWFRLTAEG